MKPYLCIESDKEVVGLANVPKESKERRVMYFVLKAMNWEEASQNAESMGAKAVRILTKKEAATEAEDGSYDIKL
jgi:diphthamide synthase (EF-2-diphthine--ammonia ligase)